MKFVSLLCLAFVFGFGLLHAASAQASSPQVDRLEGRVTTLEQRITQLGNDQGPVLFLFGIVCALWAQNTGRNAWTWFFLGMFFSIITVLVLLAKNASDLDRGRADAARVARTT